MKLPTLSNSSAPLLAQGIYRTTRKKKIATKAFGAGKEERLFYTSSTF